MLLVEENHAGVSMSTHADGKMLYTEEDRPHGCGGRGRSSAMEAVERSRMDDIIEMPEAIPNPSEVGGFMATPEVGKRRRHWNVGIVARKATRRVSAGRNKPTRTKLDQAEETQEGVRSRTTLRALNELEMDHALPS
mgnify:FL=1